MSEQIETKILEWLSQYTEVIEYRVDVDMDADGPARVVDICRGGDTVMWCIVRLDGDTLQFRTCDRWQEDPPLLDVVANFGSLTDNDYTIERIYEWLDDVNCEEEDG